MAEVEFIGLRKSFDDVETIHGIDLRIEDGEFAVFVGPSGCGKSTLLRILAGLEDVTAGELRIGGRNVNRVAPKQRGVAMVFQSYALYPHMTVYQNMAFGMDTPPGGKEALRELVLDAARMLQLDQLLDRLPRQLSGGQRQRVAIGRAVLREPDVFLLDEPLSNLDASLRVRMRMEIAKLHQRLENTMVYVTHDQVEAMTLADKIVVLNDGYLEQAGAPLELYHHPANRFVATFIGSPKMNLLRGEVAAVSDAGATVRLPDGRELLAAVDATGLEAGAAVELGVRPEMLGIDNGHQAEGDGWVHGRIYVSEMLGEGTLLYVNLEGQSEPMVVKQEGVRRYEEGAEVTVRMVPEHCHLFRADGRALPRLAT